MLCGLGPSGCPLQMATWKKLTWRIGLWLVQKPPMVSGLSFVLLHNSGLPSLYPCPCQPGCFKFKRVEKFTVSLSCVIHQAVSTAADRTVYPRRPCALPASAGVKVTFPPEWALCPDCVPSAELDINLCAACRLLLGLMARVEDIWNEYHVSFDWNEKRKEGRREDGC